LAALRSHKRRALAEAAVAELDTVKGMLQQDWLKDAEKVRVRVTRVINNFKMAKSSWRSEPQSFPSASTRKRKRWLIALPVRARDRPALSVAIRHRT
jgi:hypothetical protein